MVSETKMPNEQPNCLPNADWCFEAMPAKTAAQLAGKNSTIPKRAANDIRTTNGDDRMTLTYARHQKQWLADKNKMLATQFRE